LRARPFLFPATEGGKRQDFTALHESATAKGVAVPGFEAQRHWNYGPDLKNFNAHSGHAAISDSQYARRAKGKVENAIANPRAPVDAHQH